MFKSPVVAFAEIPLRPYTTYGQYTTLKDSSTAGIPQKKSTVSQKDLQVLAIQVLCFSVAVLVVFHQQLASCLGQLYQLIVIGFLLAIMASFMEDQIIRTMLVYLGYRRNSALQDFDAIFRKDALAPQIGILLRSVLLLLNIVPLGLAVFYKLFVGGHSMTTVSQGDGVFGFSAAPGHQRIGDGLTLLADIYQPFWTNPAINRTYGFNMFIADNNTSIIPDTPYPGYLTSLQSGLGPNEYIIVTTEVNATVSQLADPTPEERVSTDWWREAQDQFGHDWTENGGNVNGANNGLWAGIGADVHSNFSVAFLSAWNTTLNETFFSEASRCEQYRQLCNATWKVTSDDVTLSFVNMTQDNMVRPIPDQSIIQNNFLGIQEMFSNFLGEYDWHNRAGAFAYPYPPLSLNDTATTVAPSEWIWNLDVNTVCPLSAAMVWARITSLNGGDRPSRNPDQLQHTMYTKPSAEIELIKARPTLQRSYLLLLVLTINPTIVLACFLMKILLFRSPVNDGFNSVALLASTAESDVRMLRGAGFSGQLDKRIHIRFSTTAEPNEEKETRYIKAVLDQSGTSERLSRGVEYA